MKVDTENLRALRLPNGLEVMQLCPANTLIAYTEIFVDEIYRPCVEPLPDDAVVLDVGANIGLFTLYLNTTGKRLRIHCFEPIPLTFQALTMNVARHDRTGATLHDAGASNRRGTAEFTFYPRTSTSSSMYPDETPAAYAESNAYIVSEIHRVSRGAFRWLPARLVGALAERMRRWYQQALTVSCKLVRISDVIRDASLERVDLLKIDVEGAEFDCIEGIDAEHWPLIHQVIVEVHGGADDCGRMERLLRDRGLVVRRTFQQSPEIFSRHYLVEAVQPAAPGAHTSFQEAST